MSTFHLVLNASVVNGQVEGSRWLQCCLAFGGRPVNRHADRLATARQAAQDPFAFRSEDNARQDRQPDSLKKRQAI